MKQLLSIAGTVIFISLFLLTASGQKNQTDKYEAFKYRNLGAYRAGAWVGSLAVPENPGEKHKYTWYVGARAGGIWKTVNNGTTFKCISDTFGTSSIGDMAVAPSNPEIIWAGTGEAFNARSSYYGNGIWKSTDAGKSWENMGLHDSHHIAKVVIHPTNPEIVWVASMGHLFSKNEERGVLKTTNGGKTWKKVLYIDDTTGVIDLVINHSDPTILYAATYEKTRTAWTFDPGGEKSRIYKSTDGGETWNVVQGGLPEGPLGRIGLDIQRSNPDVLVAVVQNLNVKPNVDPNAETAFDEFTDHSFDNLVGGEVYISKDAGESWNRINDPETNDVSGKAAYSFNRIAIDPLDADKIYIIGDAMHYTLDGGKTWPGWREQKLFQTNFGDNRIFWIDPKDPRHMMLGSDGGVYSTFDGGLNMNHYYHLPLGEMYTVEADMETPYNIYIGLQDHETWKAPSNGWSGQITPADWVITGMWDGMYTKVDPEDNKNIYATTQFGSHLRIDQSIGERKSIVPVPEDTTEHYRYTWTTPLAISPHNSAIVYTGAQKVLRSLDRGENWEELSPDLTSNDPDKIHGKGHIQYCTITTLDESPVKAGVIWVGTDDGHVQLTTDFGHNWKDLTPNLNRSGAPDSMWVSKVFPSNYDAATAYISKCGFTDDVMEAHIYVTHDFGKTWKKITNGLPNSPVNVVIEDCKNPALLFAGNDLGIYVSTDAGENWLPFQANMPNVVVRDLLIHPRENDLIAGTYGRAAWITNITPLQQLTPEIEEKELHLFDIAPKPQLNYSQQATWGNYHMMGSNYLNSPNEPNGLEIWYMQGKQLKGETSISIKDKNGEVVYDEVLPSNAGINKIYWNTRRAEPGEYTVTLKNGSLSESKKGIVQKRWIWPVLNYSGKK
ncbi:WD40/YVTN/BNR-like repeat-containing protein [Maribellus mangrovi]|uniref:WD40/YVTN/BNR-like repeat-containing protein n=1 Tax=Maribellus mangrovi TaxID=3133146 RepID=UPI0030EF95E2